MRKPIKYALLGLVGLLVLAVAGVAVFAMTFDPNKYKGQVAAAVKEKTGRTLKLAGDLQVAFWPSLGARVAGVSLSEKGSEQEFVSLESAHVSVAVLPLLRGAAVVDGVRVAGLKANVVKDKQGKFNFDDLLQGDAGKPPAPKPGEKGGGSGAPVAFDIASVRVERSAVTYRDLASGREIAISGFELSTGRIAEQASGKLKLAAQAKGRNPDLDARLDLAADYKLDLPGKRYDLANLDLKLNGSGAGQKNLALAVTGALGADLGKEAVSGDISTKFDESNIKAKFGLTKFAAPAYTFDVDIDKLNLDRYMPAEEKKEPAKEAAKPAAAGKQAETPVDLSGLKGLNANGKLHVGALQVRGLKVADLRASVKAANGRADIAPHSANLYEGAVSGALSLNADGNRITLKEDLKGVAIGPLLKDVAQKDMLEGKGNIALDVSAAGPTVEAMKRALAGTAKVQLKDGAYKGFNLGEALRKAKALGGSRDEKQAAAETQKTDFSEMSASFTIKNGVAHNEDLDVKAPLFRVTGRGDVDIGNSKLDYTTKAAVVGTSKGQGGREVEELSGLTVPVRLVGPFDAIKYDVNYGAVAADLAKSKAGEKVKEGIEKNRGKIEDRLKGLLGR